MSRIAVRRLSVVMGCICAGFVALNAVFASSETERSDLARRKTMEVNENTFVVDGEPFLVRGMAYSPFYPGESNRDEPRKADVAEDMRKMREMGINTLLIYWTRSERIYKEARKSGLKILHGIWIDQEPNDFQDARFKDGVRRQIRHAIDYIHHGSGGDYSDTILGLWIGGEFNPASVDGTDMRHPDIKQYKGAYYQTRNGASATECFLAEMCDYARGYAKEKYDHDYLFSHINWPPTEPWLKLDFLDYAMFDVYSFWPPEVMSFRKGSFSRTSYQGYIENLKESYPKIPVVISEFGMSTAPDNVTTSGNNERDQAVELIARWHDIMTTDKPLGGGIVFEWNDEWWKQSGAAVLVPFDMDKNHHERDDSEEWFGIVGIDGPSHVDYKVRPKQAYYAVERMYASSFHTGRRAVQPIPVEWTNGAGTVVLEGNGKPLDASRQLHLRCVVEGDTEVLKSRFQLESVRSRGEEWKNRGDSLPLRYYARGADGDAGWEVIIPLEHFGPLDFSQLTSLHFVTDGEEESGLRIRDLHFSPNY